MITVPTTSSSPPFDVVPFAPEHLDGFRALFEACGSSCFCRYWHFEGTKNEWLDRCAHRPDENFDEEAAAVRAGDDSARGLVALDPSQGGRVVGWMKLTPRAAVPKLRKLAVYRSLDLGPEDTTLSVGCFVVHPQARKRGVARALLVGAERYGRAWNAKAIESYPRRSDAPLYDEEAWQGPEKLFVELGYEAVADVAPYPVYRKVL